MTYKELKKMYISGISVQSSMDNINWIDCVSELALFYRILEDDKIKVTYAYNKQTNKVEVLN